MDLNILYEDNHLIVVEKKPGILSQRDSSGVPSLLDYVKEYIKKKYKKPGNVFLGLVHRLDKQASGIVVFARTSKAARRLHREFAERCAVKMYAALVENNGAAEPGKWIERSDLLTRTRGRSQIGGIAGRGAQSARMRFMVMAANDAFALILVHLMTGRKHQIRAQLGATGMPVAGDVRYGSRLRCADDSICLHSLYLSFMHPTKKEPVSIYSVIPERITEKIVIDKALQERIWQVILTQSSV